MKTLALITFSLLFLASCEKTVTPPPQTPENNKTETNTVDIGNKPVIEITEPSIQPIR